MCGTITESGVIFTENVLSDGKSYAPRRLIIMNTTTVGGLAIEPVANAAPNSLKN
jgi:hypothetical protein